MPLSEIEDLMDPDAALAAMREALATLRQHHVGSPAWVEAAALALTFTETMDRWLTMGGAPPKAWTAAARQQVGRGLRALFPPPRDEFLSGHCQSQRHSSCLRHYGGRDCECTCHFPEALRRLHGS